MLISKLIQELQDCLDSYGDQEVKLADWNEGYKEATPVSHVYIGEDYIELDG